MQGDWRNDLRDIKRKILDQQEQEPVSGSKIAKTKKQSKPETRRNKLQREADQNKRLYRPKSPARELPPEPERGKGQTFNIGIDTGTSTTKVCVRPPGQSVKIHVLPLENADNSLCPSTVVIDKEKMYFGELAEQHANKPGARVFRRLKVCLACQAGKQPESAAIRCNCSKQPESQACTAVFAVSKNDEAALASELFTLFLAWAIGESRFRIPDALTGGVVPRCTFSISSPVDQIDTDSELRKIYQLAAYQAWRLSVGVKQGVEVATALSWIEQLNNESTPPIEDQLIEVCSESGAVAAGYALSPEIEEGLYAVVDIGAWTTEISVFRRSVAGKKQAGRPIHAFYAARSHQVSANQVDERCFINLYQMYEPKDISRRIINEIQVQRETGSFGENEILLDGASHKVIPRPSAMQFARDIVAEALGRRFRNTVKQAYEKEKVASRWLNSVIVILAGGGSMDSGLTSGITSPSMQELKIIPRPSNFESNMPEIDYRRFLVAYSLAQQSIRWPKEFLPSEVQPLDRPSPPDRLTPEDLGYSAK